MNILFLSLIDYDSISESNIYTDLLREFINDNHIVYSISPKEKRFYKSTYLINESNSFILKLKIGNIQKVNLLEKGLSTLLIEKQFISGINKYFKNVIFDYVIYSTPPITFANVISFVKKRDNAKSILLLKDIFPQNAVDIGILRKTGVKGIIYEYFRRKEKALYNNSDFIGCMSQANVDYLLDHNKYIKNNKVFICPNCSEPREYSFTIEEKRELFRKFDIPLDKRVFIYGGNLGKPQDVSFMISCIEEAKPVNEAFFVIVGKGTETFLIDDYIINNKPKNLLFISWLKNDLYNKLVSYCDIGLLFLDHRFTIPNFPSRFLTYMNFGIPVLACTDRNTDVGNIILDNNLGWWCESNNPVQFKNIVSEIIKHDYSIKKKNIYDFYLRTYSSKIVYKELIRFLNERIIYEQGNN